MNKLITLILVLSHIACFPQSAPSVEFTMIPGWAGSGQLQGIVHHTTPAGHGVAVYIFLEEAGGWWNKPYASATVTAIQPDSLFNATIAIAPTDPFATKIIAFLIPLTYSPPVISGGELPSALFSFPYTVTCRPHGSRILSWSGLDWVVKRSIGNPLIAMGPGPNIFNDHDSMVWVDGQQRLHLRVARSGNNWHCSELICRSSLGYNRYRFDLAGRVDQLDPNIIAGIFTWDDCAPLSIPADNNYREMDLEFSRWGTAGNANAQFVVQPWDAAGHIKRFNMDLTGIGHSEHLFDWRPDSILFKSSWGSDSCSWSYKQQGQIPLPGNENVRINLYLYQGLAPANQFDGELILNSFVSGTCEIRNTGGRVSIFPNPVEEGCTIDYFSDHSGDLEIVIMNLQGLPLARICSGAMAAGKNRFAWDGNSGNGRALPPGMYLLSCRDQAVTRYFKVVKCK